MSIKTLNHCKLPHSNKQLLTDVGEKGDTENVHVYSYVISPLTKPLVYKLYKSMMQSLAHHG